MFDFKNASKIELNAEYKRIAQKVGDDQFFTKKELNFLPDVLQDGEQVIAFSSGLMDGNTWLITLTDRRIIFLDKGMIFGLKQTSIPLEKVNAVSGSTGILFGEISITDGATIRKISNVWKKTVRNFTNLVEEQLAVNSKTKRGGDVVQPDGIVEKLEKLAALRDKGILTNEEFEDQKKKILS